MNVAIIPARGGSKGIVRKNLVALCGKPLVAWSIEQALAAPVVDEVFVSTEDAEIAEVAGNYGAKVIHRPAELATDTSPSEDTLIHALGVLRDDWHLSIDLVVFLQATSPVRQAEDIDNAVATLRREQADSLFSCARIEDFFIWELRDGTAHSVSYDYHHRKRRQEIVPRYVENGSIYVFRPELLLREHNRLGGKIGLYEMPQWKSFQIDNLDDLAICEYFLRTKLLPGAAKHGV